MSVFDAYAQYYDLLYEDKNYSAEAGFVAALLKRYAPSAHQLLELGCGTGIHAELLHRSGYGVHGIDFSEEMLKVAASRAVESVDGQPGLSFSCADITRYRAQREFDAVISLFHVISYQTTDTALLEAFATAAAHLRPGGVFVFDCWYGPAVLTERPEVRVKRLRNEQIEVTRIAEPELYPNRNKVDVNYQVYIRDAISGRIEALSETHHMRYLFYPEIEAVCRQSGFEIITAAEWMTDREPGFDTWGVYFVVRRL